MWDTLFGFEQHFLVFATSNRNRTHVQKPPMFRRKPSKKKTSRLYSKRPHGAQDRGPLAFQHESDAYAYASVSLYLFMSEIKGAEFKDVLLPFITLERDRVTPQLITKPNAVMPVVDRARQVARDLAPHSRVATMRDKIKINTKTIPIDTVVSNGMITSPL